MRPIMELTSRYRLESLIAAGGMGEVWRADDVVLERRVAVKLLRPEYVHDPVILARFRAEARYEGQLSHPAVPSREACWPRTGYLAGWVVNGG